jgi:hypothetical protein
VPRERHQLERRVAGGFGETENLLGRGETLVERVGHPERQMPIAEDDGEERGVVGAPRDPDGLLGQVVALGHGCAVDLLDRETAQEPRPERGVLIREQVEGIAQEILQATARLAIGLVELRDLDEAGPPAGAAERRLREELAVTQLACELRRPIVRRERASSVSGGVQRMAVRDQQGASATSRAPLRDALGLEQAERLRRQRDRVLVRPHGGGLLGGARAVRDRVVDVAVGAGARQMVRDVREVGGEVVAEQILDRRGRATMEPRPLGRGQLVVRRLAQEPVREGTSLRQQADLAQEVGLENRVEPVEPVVDHAREQAHVELASEHGCGAEQRLRARRELGRPATKELADASRQREPVGVEAARGVEASLGAPQPNGFDHEQGVAFRDLEHARAGLRIDRPAEIRTGPEDQAGHEIAGLRGAEAAQRQMGRVVRDLVDRAALCAGGKGRVGERRDQEQRHPRGVASHQAEQQDGIGVRRLHVVDRDQDRAPLGERAQDVRDLHEQLEARALRIEGVGGVYGGVAGMGPLERRERGGGAGRRPLVA